MMTLAYGVWPHEWLTFANSYLNWGKDTFVVRENQLFGGSFPPIDVPRYVLADIVAAGSYFVFGTINVYMFVGLAEAQGRRTRRSRRRGRRRRAGDWRRLRASAPTSRRRLRLRPPRHNE